MRTNSNIESAFAKTDGMIFFPLDEIVPSFVAATDAVLTRNAAGDWSYNQIASKTNIYSFPLTGLLYRLGLIPDLQEQFGTAAGVAGPSAVANTGAPSPSEGRPPYTGAIQLTPNTSKAAKGIKITDFNVHYLVTTNPLTAMTARVDKAVMPANATAAAPIITSLLAVGANGLTLASAANMYNINIPLTAPAFITDDSQEVIVELSIQTAAACTCKLYGITVHATFNHL